MALTEADLQEVSTAGTGRAKNGVTRLRFRTRCQIELAGRWFLGSRLRVAFAVNCMDLTNIRWRKNRSRNPQLGDNAMPFLLRAAPPQ